MKLLYGCLMMFSLSGCAGFVANEINDAMEIRRASPAVDTMKAFDETKLVHIKELRCFAYLEDGKKTDMDGIIFDAAGKKISTREEAIEHIRSHYGGKGLSASEKIALYGTVAWAAPVGFVFGIAENIALLPAFPYVYHVKNKYKKESFAFYQDGKSLAGQGRYPEAREKYLLALTRWGSLVYMSDIYYKIAETYEKEGNRALSEKYYKTFLEHSIALYPEHFQEFDPGLVNDRAALDREFAAAEEKINKVFGVRSDPTDRGAEN